VYVERPDQLRRLAIDSVALTRRGAVRRVADLGTPHRFGVMCFIAARGHSRTPTEKPLSKTQAAVGTATFLLGAPGVVAGLIPWWLTGWQVRQPFRSGGRFG
jgi:hypothetical protein